MRRLISGYFLWILVSSCVYSSPFIESRRDRKRTDFAAKGPHGAIAAAHPLAAEAGILVLQKGGNAVDAAVAASFAVAVLRPQSTGLGGGGFLLYFDSRAKKTLSYDFRERAPIAATRDMYLDKDGEAKDYRLGSKALGKASLVGHLAVGTPGFVAGFLKIHSKHGTLALKELLAPAIKLARQGFRVYPALAEAIAQRKAKLYPFPATRAIFFPKGRPLEPGELLVQKDLAASLEKIAKHGASGFYRGSVAKQLISEVNSGGGILTHADLQSYKVIGRDPLVGDYRSHKIVSMAPPSSGGVHIIQTLNILANFPVASLSPRSSEYNHLLIEAMKLSFFDRARYLGDPDFTAVPYTRLISKGYGKKLARSINLSRATPSADLGSKSLTVKESPTTTHVSVVDRFGNAVATTHTVNHFFGSGVVAAGTGFFLNNEMDDFTIKAGTENAFGLLGFESNTIAPRKTMLSSMSPTFVFDKLGKLQLVLGAPGGPRIISAVLQTIVNTIDFKMPLLDAVHFRRLHHQWLPDQVMLEPGAYPAGLQTKLQKLGHKTIERQSYDAIEAIGRVKNNWLAVSDSRSDGKPQAY